MGEFIRAKIIYIHTPLRIYNQNTANSVTKNASNNADRVYLGYLALAHLLEAEFSATKDKAYKKQIAFHYTMAAYYAKLAKMYKKMFLCLFKSLKAKITKPALILLFLCFVPNKMLKMLSDLRVKLSKN